MFLFHLQTSRRGGVGAGADVGVAVTHGVDESHRRLPAVDDGDSPEGGVVRSRVTRGHGQTLP